MPVVDAYAERKFQEAMEDTWGHLKPDWDKKYPIVILFAKSAYDSVGITLIDSTVPEDLPSSPWLYEDMNEFIQSDTMYSRLKEGKIYEFVGTYHKRNFRGRTHELKIRRGRSS